MTSNGRVARLTALALATGTLVAASAGSASAATSATKTKDVFNATGGGSIVSLKLNLPMALPEIGSEITQDLVSTGSNVRTSSFIAPAQAVTQAVLGSNGNIPLVSNVLNIAPVKAEYGKSNEASGPSTLPSNPLVQGGVLNMHGIVANPDVEGTIANATSSVVDLRIDGAGNLQAVLNGLVAQLTSNLTGVIGTMPTGADAPAVAGVTQTVTGLLNTVTTQLGTATQGASDPVKQAVDSVIAQLNALPQALALQLKATTADTSLLSIKTIASEHTVSRAAGVVTSHASNQILGIKLLGGLISVGSMTSDATASLGKTVSDAKATGYSDVLNVNVDNLLTVDVTSKLDAVLGGSAVPAAVKDAVNSALSQVTSILKSALGATLVGPTNDASKHVTTADHASDTESAARLVVQPAGFAKPIVDLALVPATADVTRVAAQSTSDITVVSTPAQTVTSLPRTGANLPLTGAVATGLVGLAMLARRRRMAHLAE
jgi:hypothetical protein